MQTTHENETQETTNDVKAQTITLFRTYVSTNARITVTEMRERLEEEGVDTSKLALHPRSSVKDSFRIGVRDIFQGKKTYRTPTGKESKVLITEARNAEEDVRIEVHLRKSDRRVEYSERICSFWLKGNDAGFAPDSPECWVILNKLGIHEIDPQKALAEGQDCLFENDLRRLLENALVEYGVSGWTGVHFAYGTQALAKIAAFQEAVAFLPRGQVKLSALTLEDTPRNLSQIIDDLQESFRDKLRRLLSKLNEAGPNLVRIEREYHELMVTHEKLEEELEQAIELDYELKAVDVTLAARKLEAEKADA